MRLFACFSVRLHGLQGSTWSSLPPQASEPVRSTRVHDMNDKQPLKHDQIKTKSIDRVMLRQPQKDRVLIEGYRTLPANVSHKSQAWFIQSSLFVNFSSFNVQVRSKPCSLGSLLVISSIRSIDGLTFLAACSNRTAPRADTPLSSCPCRIHLSDVSVICMANDTRNSHPW